VAAVLQVVVVADVQHHLVVGHKVVVLPVLLVLLGGPGGICGEEIASWLPRWLVAVVDRVLG
jgi:hypothetical protein